ncbi:piercer of microtubule wall 1 protein isoform X3 [Kogia breviceps]|uniref:piercer of microtubule wall 1 protein isoform X3 n=1 Tax=Kogia breviceps TaxID=27615 RepID=UPI0034D17AAA
MSEEDLQGCVEQEEPKAKAPPEKTSDYYRVSEDLPARFNNPTWFRGYRQVAVGGMFQNNTFNVYMEKSIVTGPDNYITFYDRLNFHPSYRVSKPSICD